MKGIRVVFIFISATFPFLLWGGNVSFKLYDLNRPIGSKIAVNLQKIEDEKYVLGIIHRINEALKLHPDSRELYILRNSYMYILWDIAPVDRKAMYAKIGLKYAEETIKKFPDHPDGWIRKSIFLGIYGITIGVLNVLSLAKDMRDAALKAYRIDKKYYYAMPCQVLGRLYFKLPPFPLSFGSMDKASKYLYEAMSISPDFAHIYMYLAELEAARGNIKLADEFLSKIPSIHPRTWYELLIKRWTMRTLPIARKYLREKWDKYNYDFLIDPHRHMRVR